MKSNTFSLGTVAAISTPFGKGGVAMLRISGSDAIKIASRVFYPASGNSLDTVGGRCAVYGRIYYPAENENRASAAEIDDGIAVVYQAPASFTGEDVVEICCHGGVLVTTRVLEALLAAGAEQAGAGEFTRRAFINGKMSLTEAEALGNLLDAGNEEQLKLSRSGYSGALCRSIDEIYDSLCEVLSNMEAGMDFPEEDLTDMPAEEIVERLSDALKRLQKLLDTYRTGHAIAEGIPTVICGKPNVGKSALYNRLVGSDAAIVTEVAGTTRDILSKTVSLGRVTVKLSDTAGIHDSSDIVENIGIGRAKVALDEAELVIALFDGSRLPDSDDLKLAKYLSSLSSQVIWVISKADIASADALASLEDIIPKDGERVLISSISGDGCEALAAVVEKMYIDGNIRTEEEAVVFNARQSVAIRGALNSIAQTLDMLDAGVPSDVCAESIMEAMSSLAELGGREVREDVISEIFSRFCVGK